MPETPRSGEPQKGSESAAPYSAAGEAESTELVAVPEGLESFDGEGRAEGSSPESQYCVFRAGRERFCLAVLAVEEVLDWPQVTRIPLCPPFLMGVFNLRGSIVPLVDIAFTEGRRPGLLPRHVVVASLPDEASGTNLRLGIAADEVIGTFTAADDSLLDQMPAEVPHCCGMLRHEDRLALILDLPKMISIFPVPVI